VAGPESQEIRRLIDEGLELYGTGEVSEAFRVWGRALALDPDNEVVLDYMRTADRRRMPRPEKSSAEKRSDALLGEARAMLDAGSIEEAHELVSQGADGALLAVESMADLIRVKLHERDRERFGDLSGVPVVSNTEALTQFNLGPDAGFLLSYMDGRTALSDIVSLSNMGAFDTLRMVARLCDAGILELRG